MSPRVLFPAAALVLLLAAVGFSWMDDGVDPILVAEPAEEAPVEEKLPPPPPRVVPRPRASPVAVASPPRATDDAEAEPENPARGRIEVRMMPEGAIPPHGAFVPSEPSEWVEREPGEPRPAFPGNFRGSRINAPPLPTE